jgi:hypothetical protein
VRDPHDLEPDAVVLEVFEWQVAQPGVLVVADVILDPCATAVLALDRGDLAGLVGEDRLEAMPIMVGEGRGFCKGRGGRGSRVS